MLHRLIGMVPGFLLCVAFWAAGQWLAGVSGVPLPGGVIGFAMLFLLFAVWPRCFSTVARGAELLLDNLLLFFLPAVLSIIAYPALFGLLGLKLLAALIIGTAAMMASVGLLAQFLMRRRAAPGGEKGA